MRSATLPLVAALLLGSAAHAQPSGDCDPGTAQDHLEVSDVYAALFNTGSLFFGNNTQAGYHVPKLSPNPDIPLSPVFAAGLWIGGQVDGEVRVAGARYANFEFWPGPLDDGAALPDPDDCSPYDRIWTVNVADVALYEETGEATADLAEWPVGLGAPAVDAQGDPIEPSSREQVIDLAAGERPVIYGSQTAFWVMNDVGNEHEETESDPLGVEVQVLAFSIVSEESALNQGTFYRYTVVNRNTAPITDAYVSFFVDPDLGDAADDFVGSDTTRGLGFVYNADNSDAVYGIPPAFGVDALSDDFGAFSYFESLGGGPTVDPSTAEQFYNVMQGLWGDGTPMTEGGNGYQTSGEITTFAFPGDPVTGEFWSERSEGNVAGDRRFVVNSPAFTLAAGASRTFDFGLVFAQGTDHLDSITELRAASDLVQARYDDGSLFETASDVEILDAPTLLTPDDGEFLIGEVSFEWTTVPGAEGYLLELSHEPDFEGLVVLTTTEPNVTLSGLPLFDNNAVNTYYWRVRAAAMGAIGLNSESRTFDYYDSFSFDVEIAGDGDGFVEAENPVEDPCPDEGDPGCDLGLGNTVFNDPNVTDDYYFSASATGHVTRLYRYIEATEGDDIEIRWTEEGSYGAEFNAPDPAVGLDGRTIVHVPFEIWYIGADGETQMIPLMVVDTGDAELTTDWFTMDPFVGVAEDVSGLPATNAIYMMMPDRADGYDLFEADALASGGAGAALEDTDTEVTEIDEGNNDVGDVSAASGDEERPCTHQGGYVSWCYRNDAFSGTPDAPNSNGSYFGIGDPVLDPNTLFVYPIGRTSLVDADTTDGERDAIPPVGTLHRIHITPPLPVATEPPAEQPGSYALLPAYPNPFRARTTVSYAVPTAGRVRLAVFDVLGREVAVLADGLHAAGRHEAALDGARLASGVYVVVLEADGARATRKVTLLR